MTFGVALHQALLGIRELLEVGVSFGFRVRRFGRQAASRKVHTTRASFVLGPTSAIASDQDRARSARRNKLAYIPPPPLLSLYLESQSCLN